MHAPALLAGALAMLSLALVSRARRAAVSRTL
jgi:hypothetical protein